MKGTIMAMSSAVSDEQMREWCAAQWTDKEIGETAGMSRDAANKRRRRLGLPQSTRTWTRPDNLERAANRPGCPNGHEWADGTYEWVESARGMTKVCKVCDFNKKLHELNQHRAHLGLAPFRSEFIPKQERVAA